MSTVTESRAEEAADARGQAHRRATSIVIIGAGPAGLTAAFELCRHSVTDVVVLEADTVVGGLSRTVVRDGWRFDVGGHRFFSNVHEVEAVWREILSEDDFQLRPRQSRIYYHGRFFDYPLRAGNALRGLGAKEALACLASYARARVRKPDDTSSFEGWMASRFGWRLYRIFFKTYTEKVWGVPATEIAADWAAQRIRNLSLGKAVAAALRPGRAPAVTSLIGEFHYPRFGPGQMWEACRDRVETAGVEVALDSRVVRVEHHDERAARVVIEDSSGRQTSVDCEWIISSMPLGDLARAMDPAPPDEVLAAADGLRHRDFLIVALVVPQEHAFPDNWIYIHAPEVKVGRIQNFGSWSPYLVKEGRTCLGLEYFVNEGDEQWAMNDEALVNLATRELGEIGLVEPAVVEQGFVVRVRKAYPVYDAAYADRVATVRRWLDEYAPNVCPVGRNGMHKYNNQDHSMYTAMLAVRNIVTGTDDDVWAVNVEQRYHEQRRSEQGTGRRAPALR